MIKAIICDILGVLVNTTKEGEINKELIDFLIKNKSHYGFLIIFSNSDSNSIENFKSMIPELFSIVDKQYYAFNINYPKPDVRGFEQILKELSLKPNEVIFIDDRERNTKSAQKIGIKTILYSDFKDISTLKPLLYPLSDL
jgi:glucose-1-phosphatase